MLKISKWSNKHYLGFDRIEKQIYDVITTILKNI